MSNSTSSNTPIGSPVTQVVAGEDATPGTTTGPSPAVNLDTKVSSVQDLQREAPTIWEAMLRGIASSMINDMHRRNEHLIQMMKEAEREARGG